MRDTTRDHIPTPGARPRRVPDLLLERLALGELPPAEAERVRRELAEEPGGAARLLALADSNEEILARYPPRVVAAALDRRLAVAQPRPTPRLAWAAPLAAAALALVVWVAWPGAAPGPAGDGPGEAPPGGGTHVAGVRYKGDPQLVIHRRTASGAEALASGAEVTAGDRLQLSYVASDARHGVIASLDGRGAVTLHFPAAEGASTRLTGGDAQALAFSYELDDAPRFERFFFVTGPAPIDVRAVLAAVRALGAAPGQAPALPRGLRATELLLRKAANAQRDAVGGGSR